jgi:1-acyl-sn-glycerol-3-phosphate acyltransferase
MRTALQWFLSLIFVLQMYLALAVVAIGWLPYALVTRDGAVSACRAYSAWVRFTARVLVGLRSEIRGDAPTGEVVIAAKHQSFFDIIMICSAVPNARFIMKKELIWTPFLGWYALRIGSVPVDRGKRGAAITKMMADVKAGAARPGQLIIYPQGTRVAPGAMLPYKIGTALLYSQLGQPCVPAATNVGVFWPRRGLMRKRGLAVVEFLPMIAPGLGNAEFMARIEADIEGASDRLMAEAGFKKG